MNIPVSTYRLQFTPSFGFKRAEGIAGYLSQLGISHVYASPIFKAGKGSTHGYDIVDMNRISGELGGDDGFCLLNDRLKSESMGWIQDIVPNHMAYNAENEMLMDVLENGEFSEYHHFFDIDWHHPYEDMRGRVIVPVLGKFYADALEDGEIRLQYCEKGFSVCYYDARFPIKIESYHKILEYNLDRLEQGLRDRYSDYVRFLGAVQFLKSLKGDVEEKSTRDQQIKHAKKMLWKLYAEDEVIKDFIDGNTGIINGEKGNPESFRFLDGLIAEQRYRLSFWKVATYEINYRRFFTINDLISVRVEDEGVFNNTHGLVFRLLDEKKLHGVRIDHIDGLFDPETYIQRLREKAPDCYIVVEKILDLYEHLPSNFRVQGTTGYNFLNYVNGLFCKKNNEKTFTKIYSRFTGKQIGYGDIVHSKKQLIIGKHMAGNIDNLALFVKRISSRDRHGLDITLYALRRALVEIMANFPVYRTYINQYTLSDVDRAYIREAIVKAKQKNPDLIHELGYIEKFMLLEFSADMTETEKKDWLQFVMNFQQYTGPVMAKAVEDTVFYIYNRLISLNEVGGDPGVFGVSAAGFHAFNRKKMSDFPSEMNASSTHDSKRGEDVRARINVLSEIPVEWDKRIRRWSRINRRFKTAGMPDTNDEYFIYQTLVGAYPFGNEAGFAERITAYMIKAVREAKVYTAWIKPDIRYEEACTAFIEKILRQSDENLFLNDFVPFQRMVAHFGLFNALSQVIIKMTSPGVPDVYQGCELWDLTLVDPDNRREIDFEKRKQMLREITGHEGGDAGLQMKAYFDRKEEGIIKLLTVFKCLQARKKYPEIFLKGDYVPVETGGVHSESIVAYTRGFDDQIVLSVAPRFLTSFVGEEEMPCGDLWQDTFILLPGTAQGRYTDIITGEKTDAGERVYIKDVFNCFPGCVMIRGQ